MLITALGMIIGTIPLALGEGREQNAPLGRAVIGGLQRDHFVKALVVHRTERPGVIERGCITNRLATCFQL
jgi:hypothetical protein